MAWVKLAQLSEIPDQGMIMKEHGGIQVLLARIDGQVYAMNDVCTHEGAPLHDGELGLAGQSPIVLTCPWHAAHFDLRTGAVEQSTPWATDTETYAVRIEGGEVHVDL